jgi:hypothetical protein
MSRQDTVDVRLHAEEEDVAAFADEDGAAKSGRDDAGNAMRPPANVKGFLYASALFFFWMAGTCRIVPHFSLWLGRRVKGRGATDMDLEAADRYEGKGGEFEELKGQEGPSGPQRCKRLST